jgi:uncharacterized membrane protein YkvA (DUF1232 family)
MRIDKDQLLELAREAAGFVPDVVMLFKDLAQDDRIPRRAKIEAALAAGYLVMPIDLIPDFIPGIGQLDDIAIVGWAVRRMMLGAGEGVLREHWRGSDRGLEVLMQLASFGFRGKRMIGAMALGGLLGRERGHDVVEGTVVGS